MHKENTLLSIVLVLSAIGVSLIGVGLYINDRTLWHLIDALCIGFFSVSVIVAVILRK